MNACITPENQSKYKDVIAGRPTDKNGIVPSTLPTAPGIKPNSAFVAVASSALLGLIPGALGDVLSKIPILDVGVPAILSVYFDWFSGIMQAFIFCMLTVMYIANAAEE